MRIISLSIFNCMSNDTLIFIAHKNGIRVGDDLASKNYLLNNVKIAEVTSGIDWEVGDTNSQEVHNGGLENNTGSLAEGRGNCGYQ